MIWKIRILEEKCLREQLYNGKSDFEIRMRQWFNKDGFILNWSFVQEVSEKARIEIQKEKKKKKKNHKKRYKPGR